MATGVMAAAAIGSLGYGMYSGERQARAQKEAEKKQQESIRAAEKKQANADLASETKRLEALAAEQTVIKNPFDFGVDSALNKQLAQTPKVQTKDPFNENEDNPFYTRGLM